MSPRLLIVMLGSLACSGGNARTGAPASTTENKMERTGPATHKLAWQELRWTDRNFSSLKDGRRVRFIIKDSGSYARQWREVVQDSSTPPHVDFRQRLVLFLAAPSQTRGGYAIAVDSVFTRSGSDTVNVNVREIAPGFGCTEPDDGSRPILVGTIPTTTSVIHFVERQTVSDCTRKP
jgi:hypothetical protein